MDANRIIEDWLAESQLPDRAEFDLLAPDLLEPQPTKERDPTESENPPQEYLQDPVIGRRTSIDSILDALDRARSATSFDSETDYDIGGASNCDDDAR